MAGLRGLSLLILLGLAGCAGTREAAPGQGAGFKVRSAGPQANYLHIVPLHPGAPLPPPGHLLTQAFSRDLRRVTGCVFDVSRPAAAIGNKQSPAGYVVPVSCP